MADGRASRRTSRIAFAGAAAALLALGVALRLTAPDPQQRSAAGPKPSSVETTRVASESLRPLVHLNGVLGPRRGVELFAETNGRVLAVGAEELDPVEEDQLLARVDPLLARVALERAEAAVARTTSELELARLNLERRRSLLERDVASEADLDTAENAERIAMAALREARAQRDEARDQLAKKTLVAPFAGVLRSFTVEAGEYVRDGQRVGELLDLEAVRLTVGVADREVVAVHPGAVAELRLEAHPGESFAGRVLRVGAASDPDTKKFPIEIEVPNASRRLLPGMVARATLALGEASPATLVPRDAVLDEFGLRYVYVVEPGDDGAVARRRRVSVREVPFRPAILHVVEGLAPGEELVTGGMRQLIDGASVERRAGAPR